MSRFVDLLFIIYLCRARGDILEELSSPSWLIQHSCFALLFRCPGVAYESVKVIFVSCEKVFHRIHNYLGLFLTMRETIRRMVASIFEHSLAHGHSLVHHPINIFRSRVNVAEANGFVNWSAI